MLDPYWYIRRTSMRGRRITQLTIIGYRPCKLKNYVFVIVSFVRCYAICRRSTDCLERLFLWAMIPRCRVQLPARSYSVVDNEVWQMTEMRRWFDSHSSPQAPEGFNPLTSGYTVAKVWTASIVTLVLNLVRVRGRKCPAKTSAVVNRLSK